MGWRYGCLTLHFIMTNIYKYDRTLHYNDLIQHEEGTVLAHQHRCILVRTLHYNDLMQHGEGTVLAHQHRCILVRMLH